MLAFPGMLITHAKGSGMKTPPMPSDSSDPAYDPNEYPHFSVFSTMQLGRSIPKYNTGAVSANARIIASIPEDKIRLVTVEEILAMGYN